MKHKSCRQPAGRLVYKYEWPPMSQAPIWASIVLLSWSREAKC